MFCSLSGKYRRRRRGRYLASRASRGRSFPLNPSGLADHPHRFPDNLARHKINLPRGFVLRLGANVKPQRAGVVPRNVQSTGSVCLLNETFGCPPLASAEINCDCSRSGVPSENVALQLRHASPGCAVRSCNRPLGGISKNSQSPFATGAEPPGNVSLYLYRPPEARGHDDTRPTARTLAAARH